MYSVVVMSFSLLAGQLGLVSFLQTTFAGVAGYAVAILSTRYGWSAGTAALAALVVTVATAAIFGLVSLKASGVGFMMLTLALGQMVWALSLQWIDIFKGMDGIVAIPTPAIAGFDLREPRSMYVLATLVAVACFWTAHILISSRFGLLMQGIRDNGPRMRALGHPIGRARLVAFVIASLYAAVGGILLTWETRVITPVALDLSRAVWVLTAAVIGGTMSLAGSAVGVVVMVSLEAVLSQYTDRHVLAFGLILALAILLLPNGIAAFAAERWAEGLDHSRKAQARDPTRARE
jgi:branched-chain amino acid transport system permease protein